MDEKLLTEQDFEDAAALLGCEVAAVKAVCEVEAPRGGFLPDGRVTILFERHQFRKFTDPPHAFDAEHPDISNASPGGYSRAGDGEYARFSKAFSLDPQAAMKACSWGKFQIMGFNYDAAGFSSVDAMVDAMKTGEAAQLRAFVSFVKHNKLETALKTRNWAAFASGYNGSNYRINRYDTKLAEAFRKYHQ